VSEHAHPLELRERVYMGSYRCDKCHLQVAVLEKTRRARAH
jgi:hypothetical protein